eukprot:2680675-Pyramimonas_sp.AAC.2
MVGALYRSGSASASRRHSATTSSLERRSLRHTCAYDSHPGDHDRLVRHENIPPRPASDWSVVRTYLRFLWRA